MEGNEQKKVVIELQNVKRNFIVGDEVVHALRGVSFKICLLYTSPSPRD